MVVTELQELSDRGELDVMRAEMPMPSFSEAANTETDNLDQILGGFDGYTARMTEADEEALREGLAKYA